MYVTISLSPRVRFRIRDRISENGEGDLTVLVLCLPTPWTGRNKIISASKITCSSIQSAVIFSSSHMMINSASSLLEVYRK